MKKRYLQVLLKLLDDAMFPYTSDSEPPSIGFIVETGKWSNLGTSWEELRDIRKTVKKALRLG